MNILFTLLGDFKLRNAVSSALATFLVTSTYAQAQPVSPATAPGQASVSSSGGATYFLPVKVSAGLGNIAPSLGLAYHSQSTNGDGLMGMAWHLSGLSSIERCPRTIAQDGIRGSINFDDNDRYCLDGQRLILVSGSYAQDGAQYRTEFDSFSKIVGNGRAGYGHASFKVWTKSGTVHEYGSSNDSRIEAIYAPGTTASWPASTVRVWALNRTSDAKGNYLTVAYNEDTSNGVFSPVRIDYAANSIANTQPQRSVVFNYAALSNPVAKYSAGAISRRTTVLTEISTYFQGSVLIGRTKLSYQNAGPTQAPRLAAVESCDPAGNCLLPLTMQYAPTQTGFSAGGTSWPLPQGMTYQRVNVSDGAGGSKTTVSLQDLNGDGLPDFYVSDLPYYGHRIYFNNGNGFNATGNTWDLPPNAFYHNETTASGSSAPGTVTNVSLVDLNGDGLPDVFITKPQSYPVPEIKAYTNNGAGFTGSANWVSLPEPKFQNEQLEYSNHTYGTVSLRDLNGDGLTDVYVTKDSLGYGGSPTQIAYLNTGTDFVPRNWPLPAGMFYHTVAETYSGARNAKVSLTDLNGDGLPDLYVTTPSQGFGGSATQSVFFNTGAGFSPMAKPWPLPNGVDYQEQDNFSGGDPYRSTVNLIDLNGDGLPDLCVTSSGYGYGGTPTNLVYLNTGNGFSTAATSWPLQPGATFPNEHVTAYGGVGNTEVSLVDMNGDGMVDLFVTKPGTGFGSSPNHFVYFNQSRPLSLLTNVGSTIGATVTFGYGTNSTPALYTKDIGSNATVFPKIDMLGVGTLVASIGLDNGIGGTTTTAYSYGGQKREVGSGRGSLGFRWMNSKNTLTGIEQYSEYRQDFPFTRTLAKSEVRLVGAGNAGVLKRSISTTACHVAANGAACTIAPGTIYFPFIASTAEASWDLDGTSYPSSTSSTEYTNFPHYGDPSQISLMNSDGLSKTTTFTYWPTDLSNWLVGRVKTSVITSGNP